jgi:hypothetical protein
MTSRLGTDVVALAAILGSGAVGGAVTLAAMDRGHEAPVADCVAASVMPAPRILVETHRRDGDRASTIVIAPKLHVRASHRCGVVVVDAAVRAELDEALSRVGETRLKLDRLYEQDLERRLNEEMARLEGELARMKEEASR